MENFYLHRDRQDGGGGKGKEGGRDTSVGEATKPRISVGTVLDASDIIMWTPSCPSPEPVASRALFTCK